MTTDYRPLTIVPSWNLYTVPFLFLALAQDHVLPAVADAEALLLGPEGDSGDDAEAELHGGRLRVPLP